MCPACLTTLALISVGTGLGGAVAGVIVQKIRVKPNKKGKRQ